MSRMSKRKGASGERQFCKWLWTHLEIDADRNLEQSRNGGHDIDTPDFIIEVKRVENLNVAKAWLQCVSSARRVNQSRLLRDKGEQYGHPVLAYRKNGQPWSFAISAQHIGLMHGYIMLPERPFIEWAKLQMENPSYEPPM